MDYMRVEVGMKESSKKKLLKSTWFGHVQKMGDENLAKIADAQKVEGKSGERGIAIRDCFKAIKRRRGMDKKVKQIAGIGDC